MQQNQHVDNLLFTTIKTRSRHNFITVQNVKAF